MNRRSFIAQLALGITVVGLAPSELLDPPPPRIKKVPTLGEITLYAVNETDPILPQRIPFKFLITPI